MRIELRDVSIGYHKANPAAERITCTFESGDFSIVRGPSGSGKSCFLKTLNRLTEPLSGAIFADREDITTVHPPLLRRRAAYIPQLPVFTAGTVRRNLLLPFSFRAAEGCEPPGDDLLRGYLDKLLLEDISLDGSASALSVGQKQRLAFIRALLINPRYLLLDEPTSALDGDSRFIMERWIEEFNRETGTGIIMVTHHALETGIKPSRVFSLSGGRLLTEKG